jgi:hypothetical protein
VLKNKIEKKINFKKDRKQKNSNQKNKNQIRHKNKMVEHLIILDGSVQIQEDVREKKRRRKKKLSKLHRRPSINTRRIHR